MSGCGKNVLEGNIGSQVWSSVLLGWTINEVSGCRVLRMVGTIILSQPQKMVHTGEEYLHSDRPCLFDCAKEAPAKKEMTATAARILVAAMI